jgi:hypothetical protein
MSFHSQIHPTTLIGTLAERPAALSITKEGTTYFATDTLDTYLSVLVGGVMTWELEASGTIAGGGLGKYFVNVAGQEPVTPYTSVNDAIDAMVADGHDAANPGVCWVLPGVYSEGVIVLPAGISIQGMVQDFGDLANGIGNLPNIIASVIFSPAGTGSSSLSNLAIGGSLSVTGATAVGLVLDHVAIIQTAASAGASPFLVTNPIAQITILNSSVVSLLANPSPSIDLQGAATLTAFDLSLNADADQPAFNMNAGGTVRLRNSRAQGQFTLAGVGTVILTDCALRVGALPAFALGAGIVVTVIRGTIFCANAIAVSGVGIFTQTDVAYTSIAGTYAATVVTTAAIAAVMRQKEEIVIPPGGTITTTDEAFTMDATAGNTAMNLLALATVPRGYEPSLKKVSVANTVTVTPDGAETIDGAATFVLVAGKMSAVILRAASATDWHIVAAY